MPALPLDAPPVRRVRVPVFLSLILVVAIMSTKLAGSAELVELSDWPRIARRRPRASRRRGDPPGRHWREVCTDERAARARRRLKTARVAVRERSL